MDESSSPLEAAIAGFDDAIEIGAGASKPVTISLTLDQTKVPSPAFGSLSFGGFLHVTGEGGSIAIPWSFVKASRVRVTWMGSGTANVKLGTERMSVSGSTGTKNSSVDLFVGAGAASLWVEGRAADATYHIIRDDLDLAQTPDFTLRPSDAPHHIRFAGTDVHGRPLGDRDELSDRNALLFHPRFQADLFDAFVDLFGDVVENADYVPSWRTYKVIAPAEFGVPRALRPHPPGAPSRWSRIPPRSRRPAPSGWPAP